MNPTFQLVSAAVGDPDLPPPTTSRRRSSSCFDLYDVQLPRPQFSGIPSEWTFAALAKERVKAASGTRESIFADARSIITRKLPDQLIVLLSDDPKVHLVHEFGSSDRDVFCLDYAELSHSKDFRTQPRLAPFILAVQRKLNANPPLLARSFSPYQRNSPASGWRFFGREKQLREIIQGNENHVVVGARRVGKTSLLHEAERRLREDGRAVYYVDVEDCRSANDVVREILHVVSPRDAAHAVKHHEAFGESVLSNLCRRLSSGPGKTVLLLDELGNVLANLPEADWSFMGVLRKYGAKPGLKYVISCWQELYFKQQHEFTGPLINFAHTLRLDVFNRKEVEEFVIAPLEFWKTLGSTKKDLLDLIISKVGTHPYFLQFFCHAFFDRFAADRNFNPIREAHVLLEKDLHEWFPTAVDELFFRIPSATLRFLFLRRCHEAEASGQQLSQAEFSDDWLDATLNGLGYRSTVSGRKNIMDGLEMHGLCAASDYDRSKEFVAAPLVYQYIRKSINSFDNWLAKLGKEIERERGVWELSGE
jgi:hypothetical protein